MIIKKEEVKELRGQGLKVITCVSIKIFKHYDSNGWRLERVSVSQEPKF